MYGQPPRTGDRLRRGMKLERENGECKEMKGRVGTKGRKRAGCGGIVLQSRASGRGAENGPAAVGFCEKGKKKTVVLIWETLKNLRTLVREG